ncbi:MAG: MauE/DoxX family redox-associated membrane protein [Anaerolineales bacterium]|nr:MauE/DoxX family redox-associated membrane protein [Anaerolineales bacterium]
MTFSRLALALAFAASSLGKLRDHAAFEQAVRDFRVLPERLVRPGAYLFLASESAVVVLMRVLVQRPAIFILDEATASVDPFTEEQIQQALDLLLHRSTATSTSLGTGIIIAHRLSTVKSADRIVVLRKGQIIEEGNHNALLAQGGHYAELYNTYFRHQSLEAINAFGEYRRMALAAD